MPEEPFKTYTTEAEFDSDVDKRVAKAINTAREKWEIEAKEREEKAKKMAKLSLEDQKKAAFQEREDSLTKKERELNLKENTMIAQNQLEEKGLSKDFVDFVLSDDPEKTAQNIDGLLEKFNGAVSSKVDEISKTKTPGSTTQTGNSGRTSFEDEFKKQLK